MRIGIDLDVFCKLTVRIAGTGNKLAVSPFTDDKITFLAFGTLLTRQLNRRLDLLNVFRRSDNLLMKIRVTL